MSLTLEDLIAKHQEKTPGRPVNPNKLHKREYRERYPLIKEAVLKGVPLWSVISILQKEDGAFEGMKIEPVWQAFRRALKAENIILSKIEK